MSKSPPLSDLRGASRLAIDLALAVTEAVETLHHNIARLPAPWAQATHAPATGITGFVYRRIRGTMRLVGHAIDAALAPLATVLGEVPEPRRRDAVVSALNGVLGDHLAATHNSLAIAMQLRIDTLPVAATREAIAAALPAARDRVIVLVHGLCLGEAAWTRDGHDHGRRLAHDLRADAVYLRYNTGLHVSTSGAALAALLATMVDAWPVRVRELILVGHSMGGLVIRAACAAGMAANHTWMKRLRGLVFLGTPHHGAPLERAGHGVDLLLAASPYTAAFARLSRLRSAGITDLRHGYVRGEDWSGGERLGRNGALRHAQPLPRGVPALAVAGSLSRTPSTSGRPSRGDGLVPLASALGMHADPRLRLDIARSGRKIVYATGHLDLLSSSAVYQRMRRWLNTRLDEVPRPLLES